MLLGPVVTDRMHADDLAVDRQLHRRADDGDLDRRACPRPAGAVAGPAKLTVPLPSATRTAVMPDELARKVPLGAQEDHPRPAHVTLRRPLSAHTTLQHDPLPICEHNRLDPELGCLPALDGVLQALASEEAQD